MKLEDVNEKVWSGELLRKELRQEQIGKRHYLRQSFFGRTENYLFFTRKRDLLRSSTSPLGLTPLSIKT